MIDRIRTCADVDREALAAEYASGRIQDRDLAPFEEHLLTCGECQQRVREAVAMRRALRAPASLPPRRRRIAVPMLAAAALITLVAGSLVVPARARRSAMTRLGNVDHAPDYTGVPVRAAPSAADSAFAAAMTDYRARRYAAAAHRLGEITASSTTGATSATLAPVAFFRGASLLMIGRPAEARTEFDRVLAEPGNPYTQEAHYYRALASLRLGDGLGARLDLEQCAARDGAVAERARLLMQRLEERRSP